MKKILKNRFWVIAILCMAIGLSCSDAFAWGHGGGDRHYYRDGRWYRHGWLGFDIAVSSLTVGALIDSLPPRCTTVMVGGVPYYYDNNVYYRQYPYGGYVVVQPPVVAAPVMAVPEAAPVVVAAQAPVVVTPAAGPQAQVPETLIVNIPNSRGGYTSVTMKRSGNGFIGPQGEYYPEHPTVEQLKVLYGK